MTTMNAKMGWMAAAVIFGFTPLTACGTDTDDKGGDLPTSEATADGERKVRDGKADAWNWRNDPRGFRASLDYEFEALPLEGRTNNTPWTASYWPYYQDGINHRWQKNKPMTADAQWRGLSPAEKYDIAFNDWTPAEGFTDLAPFNPQTCEFDAAYYDGLGPAATWTHQNKGIAPMTNGVDDDEDGVADADECAQNQDAERADFDRIETWWGICHAWAPAALVEDEPLAPVTRNGVTFDVSDQKGLIMQQWDRASAYMVGGRCNEDELERDDTGRVTVDECRDLNAGSWHVIVTNFIGLNRKGIVIERTTNYEVWNQPLFGYKITEQREISQQEALTLLNLETEVVTGEETGEFVHEVEEGSARAKAILELVNTADLELLDDDAGLYSTAAKNIIKHRDGADATPGTEDDNLFDTLTELDEVSYVGSSAFGQLLGYAVGNGYLEGADYKYNADAERFIEVRMSTDWITEQHQSAERTDTIIDRYTMHDHYHYILELDADGKIIGGEWVGDSNVNHPDFVWLPVREISGNPNIDIETVRDIIAEGRQIALGDEEPVTESLSFSNDEIVRIPDNDPAGATSTIEVDRVGTVESITINANIEHTYRGDVYLELRHGGVSINVFNGHEVSTPWEDNIVIEAAEVNGFEGANLSGDWELFAVDTYGYDVGQITSWSIDFTVSE